MTPAHPTEPSRPAVAVAAALVVAQFVVLYLPDPSAVPGVDLPVPHLDKIVHVGAFALPTWALVRLVRRRHLVVVAMLAQAVVSEVVQGALLPNRGFEWLDLAADVAGVGLGLALAAWTPTRGPRPAEL